MELEEKQELAFLRQIKRKMESDKKSILLRAWFNPALWLFCASMFFVAFQLYGQSKNPFILVIPSAIVGALIAVISVHQNGERSWVHLEKYLKKQEILDKVNAAKT